MNYVVLAIPVFFLLIGLELAIARVQEGDYYSLSDSVSDLGCGLVQQIVEAAFKTVLFAGYLYLYNRWRVFEISMRSVLAWGACLVGQDFLYYWFHRKSHEVNAFWAAHVVHHQSEEYNLAVALRQGAFQTGFSWTFYLPLALLGFPPLMFLTVSSVDSLYQFWIHTRVIGRLGPLEGVLNTPSNHRVHHGRNPKYIDRNHGGILIVWDRIFGTYVREEEEPVYGVTTPLQSWNPVWANLHYWAELLGKARRAARPADKLRLFFARPGWLPADLGGYQAPPAVDRARARRFHVPVPGVVRGYAFAQFVAAIAFGVLFLFREQDWSGPTRAGAALFLVASLVTVTGLLEARPWAPGAEGTRLVLLGLVAAVRLAGGPGPAAVAAVAGAGALLVGLLRSARAPVPSPSP